MKETDPRRYTNWWYCDNVVSPAHEGQFALLHMGEPQVFILVRDSLRMNCDFEEFRDEIAEINFMYPEEREHTDIETLLTDAWNFLALQEAEDENAYYKAVDEALNDFE